MPLLLSKNVVAAGGARRGENDISVDGAGVDQRIGDAQGNSAIDSARIDQQVAACGTCCRDERDTAVNCAVIGNGIAGRRIGTVAESDAVRDRARIRHGISRQFDVHLSVPVAGVLNGYDACSVDIQIAVDDAGVRDRRARAVGIDIERHGCTPRRNQARIHDRRVGGIVDRHVGDRARVDDGKAAGPIGEQTGRSRDVPAVPDGRIRAFRQQSDVAAIHLTPGRDVDSLLLTENLDSGSGSHGRAVDASADADALSLSQGVNARRSSLYRASHVDAGIGPCQRYAVSAAAFDGTVYGNPVLRSGRDDAAVDCRNGFAVDDDGGIEGSLFAYALTHGAIDRAVEDRGFGPEHHGEAVAAASQRHERTGTRQKERVVAAGHFEGIHIQRIRFKRRVDVAVRHELYSWGTRERVSAAATG